MLNSKFQFKNLSLSSAVWDIPKQIYGSSTAFHTTNVIVAETSAGKRTMRLICSKKWWSCRNGARALMPCRVEFRIHDRIVKVTRAPLAPFLLTEEEVIHVTRPTMKVQRNAL